MRHCYLLFDSACSVCSRLASDVEKEVGKLLELRSLQEKDIQEILNEMIPGWQWKPMLLEIDGNRKRIYTGLAMGLYLLRRLGPWKALRIANLVKGANLGNGKFVNIQRREFLWRGGNLLAVSALLLRMPLLKVMAKEPDAARSSDTELAPPKHDDIPPDAELYEGFLIIPEEAQLPAFVKPGQAGGDILILTSMEEFLKQISYPILLPSYIPSDLQFVEAQITPNVHSNQMSAAALFFSNLDADSQPGDPQLILFLDRFPPHPAPFKVARNDNDELVYPEKVSFTPNSGLKRVDDTTNFTQWFDQGILYTLVTRSSDTLAVAQSLSFTNLG